MTARHPDRQTEWNDNKAHSVPCERDAILRTHPGSKVYQVQFKHKRTCRAKTDGLVRESFRGDVTLLDLLIPGAARHGCLLSVLDLPATNHAAHGHPPPVPHHLILGPVF